MITNETEEKVTNELHDHIDNGVIGAVQRFVQNHPKVKFAYNSSRESALITALKTKNFDIFSYLVSQGFTYGESEDFKSIVKLLTPQEQQNFRKTHATYFQDIESPHILDLMQNSRLHFHSDKRNFQQIQKFYGKLDKIPEIQPLLQVVANAENLDIVFDFNCASISGLNPNEFDESTRGEAYVKSGVILIGANREKEADTLGILAHELAHYAMQLIYENDAKPYLKDDTKQREKFEKIIEEYTNMENHEKHINVAIKYQSKYLKIVELIVRVPHLIALHIDEPEMLNELRKRYKNLFDFYETKVLPDLRNEFPRMKSKRKIQDLNELLGVYNNFEAPSMVTCVASKFDIPVIQDDEQNIFVLTEVPELVYATLIKHLKQKSKKVESSLIFIGIDQLAGSRYKQFIGEAFESEVKPKMFVIHSSQVNEKATDIEEFITERLPTARIVLVSNHKFEFLEKFSVQKEVEHEWVDLEEASQNEILNWKIDFQGKNVELSKIMSEEFFHQISLKDIFKLKELKIDAPKNALKDSEIYIDRTFKNNSGLTFSCDEVLANLEHNRRLVIANDAGMGKTTIARYFAKDLPKTFQSCWVVFLDLKEHTNSYFKDGQKHPPVVDFEFLIKLLKLESLKLKIFQHLYETGKVIFVLDGFDEISPKYKECLLKIIDTVKDSKNRLMITTRTHLAKDLEHQLKVEALKFKSLDDEEGIKLLTMLLCKRRQDGNGEDVDEHSDETKAKLLYKKFKDSLQFVSLFDSPLIVTMISEFDEEDLQDFNVYTLYERFVEKKIKIWNKKGQMALDDNVTQKMNSTDIIKIHREKALQVLLDDEIFDSLQIQKSEIDEEQITRFGLIYFVGENFQFVHRSFAEYFLANYLILNLKQATILNPSDKFTNVFMSIVQSSLFFVEKRLVEAHLEEIKNSLIGKFTVDFTIRKARGFVLELFDKKLNNLLCVILANLNLNNAQKLELLEYPYQLEEEFNLNFLLSWLIKLVLGKTNNIFHYWSERTENIDTFFVLYDWAKTFVSQEKLYEMFFIQKDVRGQTSFYLAMVNNRFKKNEWESLFIRVSGSLSNIDFSKLLQDKTQSGVFYFHAMPSQLFPLIWNSDEVKLDVSDRKKLLSKPGFEGFNFLMSAIYYNSGELVDCILNEAKKLFTEEELDEYLASKSKDNETCLHIAARRIDWKVFEYLLIVFKDTFSDSRLKSLLMEKDSSGQIILYILAKKNRRDKSFIESFINFMWGLNFFTNEEKETFLSQIQSENEEFNKRFDDIDNILEYLSSGSSREETRKFLKYELENGENCLIIAARTANLDQFRLLWKFVEKEIYKEEQKVLLKRSLVWNLNFTFTSKSLKSADSQVLDEILIIGREILDPSDYSVLSKNIKRLLQF